MLALHHSKECAGGLGVIGFLFCDPRNNYRSLYKSRAVIPAKAGIHASYWRWIPAFAGMTIWLFACCRPVRPMLALKQVIHGKTPKHNPQ
jgi:hypothetical protein